MSRYLLSGDGQSTQQLGPQHVVTLGTCMGIELYARGVNDPHICFRWLVEDDGNWFRRDEHSGSSVYWVSDAQEVLQRTQQWLEHHTIDGVTFREHGVL